MPTGTRGRRCFRAVPSDRRSTAANGLQSSARIRATSRSDFRSAKRETDESRSSSSATRRLRPAGFGERGEETCPRESACGPVAKAPDEPPTPTGYAPPLDSTQQEADRAQACPRRARRNASSLHPPGRPLTLRCAPSPPLRHATPLSRVVPAVRSADFGAESKDKDSRPQVELHILLNETVDAERDAVRPAGQGDPPRLAVAPDFPVDPADLQDRKSRGRHVALRTPGPSVGARPPRHLDHRRPGRRWLAERRDGRPLRRGRRRRGRHRRQTLRGGTWRSA